MAIRVDMPVEIESVLRERWGDLSQHLKESMAIEGYQQRLLGLAQVRRLLGLATRWDAQLFLGERGVAVFDLDEAEVESDADAHRALRGSEQRNAE
jgi:predicted HTH domain antitoxin